jgi:hypothetical protein
MNGGHSHSDYYPVFALDAPKARFLDQEATLLRDTVLTGMPVLDLLEGRTPPRRSALGLPDESSVFEGFQQDCGWMVDAFRDPAAMPVLKEHSPEEAQRLERVLAAAKAPIAASTLPAWTADLAAVARCGPGALATGDLRGAWIEPTWLAAGQGPEVGAIMAAYQAAAERDAASMQTTAEAVLNLKTGVAAEMREQMLLIAMAGAAGQRDFGKVREFDRRFGAALPRDDDYGRVRRLVAAWAER